MINPFVNIGTKFYICADTPLTYDATGYGALTFTQIRGMRSIDDIGEKYDTVDFNTIGNIRRQKRVGKATNTIQIEIIKITDAGQDLLKASFSNGSTSSYKVIAADGAIYYFTADCNYIMQNPGNKSSIADIKGTLDINSNLLQV